jgi:thiol-disulfide isomerase/thioredoxin
MIDRRSLLASTLALGAAAALSPALADNRWPFEMSAFEKAQAEGKPIFIEVYAPWCPTCRRQQPIIDGLLKKPEFAGIEAFTLDYDNQKDALKALRVTGQSTLIAFKGGKETGRAIAITDPKAIEKLMRSAL